MPWRKYSDALAESMNYIEKKSRWFYKIFKNWAI